MGRCKISGCSLPANKTGAGNAFRSAKQNNSKKTCSTRIKLENMDRRLVINRKTPRPQIPSLYPLFQDAIWAIHSQGMLQFQSICKVFSPVESQMV